MGGGGGGRVSGQAGRPSRVGPKWPGTCGCGRGGVSCDVRVMIHCFSHLTCTHIHSAVWSFVILGDGSHFDFYFDFHSHVRGGVHIA